MSRHICISLNGCQVPGLVTLESSWDSKVFWCIYASRTLMFYLTDNKSILGGCWLYVVQIGVTSIDNYRKQSNTLHIICIGGPTRFPMVKSTNWQILRQLSSEGLGSIRSIESVGELSKLCIYFSKKWWNGALTKPGTNWLDNQEL